MRCPKCGKENSNDSAYCAFCGGSLPHFTRVTRRPWQLFALGVGVPAFAVAALGVIFVGVLPSVRRADMAERVRSLSERGDTTAAIGAYLEWYRDYQQHDADLLLTIVISGLKARWDWAQECALEQLCTYGAPTDERVARAVQGYLSSHPPSIWAEMYVRVGVEHAERLTQLGGKPGRSALVACLSEQEPLFWVRGRAAYILCYTSVPEAAGGLRTLADGPPGFDSIYASAALVKLGNREFLPAVQRALSSQDASLREEAAEALAVLGEQSGVRVLEEWFWKIPERAHALGPALARLGGSGSREVLLAAAAQSDDDTWQTRQIRDAAIGALALLGDRRVVPHARKAGCLVSLAYLGEQDGLEAMRNRLTNPKLANAQGRAQAAKVLGEIADKGSTEVLADALRDESWSVRVTAAAALLNLTRSVAGIRHSLRDSR